MADLFGQPDGPAMTAEERRKRLRKASEQPRGYYRPPGTGPEGETCRSCAHATTIQASRVYWKCNLSRQVWGGSIRTDIRLKSPACSAWSRDPTLTPEAADEV